MEKIINVKVSGSEIEQSSNYGGIQGEGGARLLKICFDEEWQEYSKSVTFFDCNMKNPVKVMLTTDIKAPDGAYNVFIPSEPLKEGERFTYIIEGSKDGALQRSVKRELKVKDAPTSENASLPSDITPSLSDQLNLSIQKEAGRISVLEERTEELEEKEQQHDEKLLNHEESITFMAEGIGKNKDDIKSLENTVNKNESSNSAWHESLLDFYLPFMFEGYTASEAQAKEGTNNENFLTPKTGKAQIEHLLAKELINTPEIYTKETTEGMYALEGMKHGDMCIILSAYTDAQSIYRYYTKDINGNSLSTPQWVWLTDLSIFAPGAVLTLEWRERIENEHEMTYFYEELIWDYSKGNTARVNEVLVGDYMNLYITNVKSGDFGIIDVYNDKYGYFESMISSEYSNFNSYAFPPDWDYLYPEEGQHFRYSFYYDGNKFDWTRSVRNDN